MAKQPTKKPVPSTPVKSATKGKNGKNTGGEGKTTKGKKSY